MFANNQVNKNNKKKEVFFEVTKYFCSANYYTLLIFSPNPIAN